jgi:hypothetical protein
MKAIGLLIGRAGSIDQTFRKCSILLVFVGLTCGPSLLARAESDPKACRGVDFEVKRPLAVSRVSARPHVNLIKSSDDDATCPADKEICRKKVYLVLVTLC